MKENASGCFFLNTVYTPHSVETLLWQQWWTVPCDLLRW